MEYKNAIEYVLLGGWEGNIWTNKGSHKEDRCRISSLLS